MVRNRKPESDLFGPPPLSMPDLGHALNDDEWAVIDEALDRMHREAAEAKKSDAPASENQ